jgi:hypothetical protein
MGMNFSSVTLTAGTPLQLSLNTNPAQPTSISAGVTTGIPVTAFQITIQAATNNTGNIFIGGPGLNKATGAGVGQELIPGASITLGQYGGQLSLDDLWADTTTTGNLALVSIIG